MLRILSGERLNRLNPILNGTVLRRPVDRVLRIHIALRLLPATPESANRARDEAAEKPAGERLQRKARYAGLDEREWGQLVEERVRPEATLPAHHVHPHAVPATRNTLRLTGAHVINNEMVSKAEPECVAFGIWDDEWRAQWH